MSNLKVNIAGIELKNPIMPASGTFGFGYTKLFEYSLLGAIVSKGITVNPRGGNEPPRITESHAGLINSVGLQNDGIDRFAKYMVPYYKSKNDVLIANIAGFSIEDYKILAEKLDDTAVDMIEVNISCPNVENGGIIFGTSSKNAAEVVKQVKSVTKKPIMVKLSPNVTDIAEIAKAVETEGANAISLINTILSMQIDIRTKKPILKNNTGGLSGPAVFPIALRMVYEVARNVKIPVVGVGGISSYKNVIEMMMAGATAVQIGSANFTDPFAMINIINDTELYLKENKIEDINSIIGCVTPW